MTLCPKTVEGKSRAIFLLPASFLVGQSSPLCCGDCGKRASGLLTLAASPV